MILCLQILWSGGAPERREGTGDNRESFVARMPAEEHRLHRGHRRVLGPRDEGDAQQRRPPIQGNPSSIDRSMSFGTRREHIL